MANTTSAKIDTTGLTELARNLKEYASDQVMGRAALTALGAGGRVVRTAAAKNARALGLGVQGMFERTDGRGVRWRGGRIPRALAVGRAFVKNQVGGSFRVRVYARGGKGRVRNKAAHAHLIEYGWRHQAPAGGVVNLIPGRAYLHPALQAKEEDAINAMGQSMLRSLARAQFPTTGKP